jgi:hypothetical protein
MSTVGGITVHQRADNVGCNPRGSTIADEAVSASDVNGPADRQSPNHKQRSETCNLQALPTRMPISAVAFMQSANRVCKWRGFRVMSTRDRLSMLAG